MENNESAETLKDKLQKKANSAFNTIKDLEVPDPREVGDKFKNAFRKKEKPEDAVAEPDEETVNSVRSFSAVNAAKIFYYMIAVDGKIEASEEEKFELVGSDIYAAFPDHKAEIIDECKKVLENTQEVDCLDVIKGDIERMIALPQDLASGVVPVKLLIWNLLTIAYSDGVYDEPEKQLIEFIIDKADMNKDIFLEMESSYLSVMDIDKELEWIKGTDRPYKVIEQEVKELERREQVIFESVKSLIYL